MQSEWFGTEVGCTQAAQRPRHKGGTRNHHWQWHRSGKQHLLMIYLPLRSKAAGKIPVDLKQRTAHPTYTYSHLPTYLYL